MEDYVNKADAFICNENNDRIFCMMAVTTFGSIL